jgi:hypothetical protein
METLIIPDVHEKIDVVKKILKKYPSMDRYIYLGDWMDSFDNYGEPTDNTRETIDFIAENAANPRWTFLWGNHDLQYAFSNQKLFCSGYNLEKQELIKNKLNVLDHWDYFKLLTWVENSNSKWLVSHAGLHPKFVHPVYGFEKWSLISAAEKIIIDLKFHNYVDFLLCAGSARGGSRPVGGITWLDWDKEFVPILGLNQIVGHTQGRDVRWNPYDFDMDSMNYCIDTGLNHVMLMRDEGIQIIQVFNL